MKQTVCYESFWQIVAQSMNLEGLLILQTMFRAQLSHNYTCRSFGHFRHALFFISSMRLWGYGWTGVAFKTCGRLWPLVFSPYLSPHVLPPGFWGRRSIVLISFPLYLHQFSMPISSSPVSTPSAWCRVVWEKIRRCILLSAPPWCTQRRLSPSRDA